MKEEGGMPEKGRRKPPKDKNREFAAIAYAFIGIFIAMIGYFCYFQIFRSEQFIDNPYNKRLEGFSAHVVRGDIVSSDGTLLATTSIAEDGSEEREYPAGRTYAHVVGFADNGKSGLEAEYDFELLRSHTFFLEKAAYDIAGKKNPGDTLVTTLDDGVQRAAYGALGGDRGAVVAIEADTGRILAMVSKPDFDPGTIEEDWNSIIADPEGDSVLLNRACQGLYPPGSTFKLVTALEYIREHPDDYKDYSYDCDGSITEGGYTLHCYGGEAHGRVDLTRSLAKSCNSSFANIGLTLDSKRFKKTAEDLLFNEDLPVDLPYSKSSFSPGDDESSAMASAIGQGETLASPVHMALIACAIQNGGILMRPYLAERIENADGGVVRKYGPEAYGRLMGEKEAKILRRMMKAVVQYGTASALAAGGYTAAGKTGSAEYGGNGESHAWFVGYANAKGRHPIAIAVIAEGAGSGSAAAVPIAKTVFDTYFDK